MYKITRLAPFAAISFVSLTGIVACGDDDSNTPTPILPGADGGSTEDTDGQTGATGSTDSTDDESTSDDSTDDVIVPPGSPDAATTDATDESGDGGVTGAADGGDSGIDQLPTISNYLKDSDDFTVLASALAEAELDATLDGNGEYTLFAPTDEAFALLPEELWANLTAEQRVDLLKYHVVEGSVDAETVVGLDHTDTLLADGELKVNVVSDDVYLNGLTKLVVTDIETSNGVIHVIDSVLVPGPFPGTVADVLGAYPRLSILLGASADVTAELSEDDITLFAPTDQAFLGVDLGDVDDLDSIVLYHALPDSVSADAAADLRTARTVGGAFVGLKVDGGLKLNDSEQLAAVSYTDIQVASGDQGSTIHLIDKVLTPPGSIAQVAANVGLTGLVEALALGTVVGTETTFEAALGGEGTFTVFAPSDEAFEAAPAIGFGLELGSVLGAHVLNGALDSNAALAEVEDDGLSPETLTGSDDDNLALTVVDGKLTINSLVQVTESDIPASNGVIHVVDSVIVPSDIEFPGDVADAIAAYPSLSALAEATANAEEGDVAAALAGAGPFTLFAPTNAAFEGVDTSADLSAVLLFHAVGSAYYSDDIAALEGVTEVESLNGADLSIDPEELTVEGAAILRADLRTSNGVIHVVDEVLTPPN
jgi:transforming growth factor-beta-induced protein